MPESLEKVMQVLESVAPLELAADWDNVGLLVDPGTQPTVEVILLCIDLTEAVLEEAILRGADMIVAYHPPIFSGLKALGRDVPLQRVILKSIQHGISVYSPHTALDAAENGVNDWLADALGTGTREIIEPDPKQPTLGQGRRVTLDQPTPLPQIMDRVKKHLGLSQLRVAYGTDPAASVQTISLCPGAGGSVILNEDVDVILTGEMRHHDVLSAAAKGITVILSEHTHTERGYLPVLQEQLTELLEKVDVSISSRDADPLQLV